MESTSSVVAQQPVLPGPAQLGRQDAHAVPGGRRRLQRREGRLRGRHEGLQQGTNRLRRNPGRFLHVALNRRAQHRMNRAGSSRLIAGLTCLAAAACARTSPATRAAEGAAPAPLPAALADGGAAGYRLRVLLARHHRARVEPRGGGPWSEADQVGLNAFTPAVKGPYPYVVVEPGAWPRVLSEYGGVRLLLYVDPADAQPVAVRTTRLRPQADQPASGDVGVTNLSRAAGRRRREWPGNEGPHRGRCPARRRLGRCVRRGSSL